MLSYGEFAFFQYACGYATAAVENNTAGQSIIIITIGDSRLCTVASATGLRDAESIIFNRGRSVASWTFTVGYFIPLNGPLNGHPPSIILWR